MRWLLSFLAVAFSCTAPVWADSDSNVDLKSTKINFNIKNGKILEIINKISRHTDYVFIYEDEIEEELNQVVKIKSSETLYDLLSEISKQSELEFRAVNQNIVIRKKSISLFKTTEPSQGFRVSGRVTSLAENTGLPGVNIIVKGTSHGTISDINGNYVIEVTDQNGTLIFSSVGYETEEVSIAGRNTINVTMAESIASMQEVVVTALGIEREKRSLGYAVSEVSGQEITTVAQENAVNALAGRVPGMTINQLSGVGSSVSVIIRGATSLSGDNQPLFVIDGVPVANNLNNMSRMGDRNEVDYGNPISDLNPDDIATISVLKGPSAAALYGSRAGNGVILITTKSGKKGDKLSISFSSSNVFERPVRYLDFHYRYASGNRNAQLDELSAYWAGPELDRGITAVQWNSPIGADGNRIPTELRSYPDNMKNFLETGITSTNSIALSGSSERSTYRFSYTNMSHNGMIPNSDLFRNNITTSGTYDLSNKLKLSTNINLVRSNSNDRPSTGNRGANPVEAVYNWPHVDIRELKNIWVPGQEEIQQLSVSQNHDNPYFIAYGITNAFTRDRAFGNIKLDYEISPEFSAFARISHDVFIENRETKIPWSYTRERSGAYHLQDLSRNETNADFLVTYNKLIGDFNISVSGGGNYMTQSFRDNYMGSAPNAGIIVPGLYRISNVPNTGLIVNNFSSRRAIYSLYGLTSIGFKDQLYLDLTARNDWSSTLPASNRSYFYPSASLSWLANYTFNLPQNISLLKLRAGVAQVGNDTNPYGLEPVLGTGNWGSLITTNYPGTLLNPNLKPEIATSTELGIDLNLFNNRIRFEGTYYHVENRNQILVLPTPVSSGFTAKQINAGLLASRGWELMLGGTPIKNDKGLTWDINANFTRMRTTVESLAEGMDFITLWDDNNGGAQTYVGEEIGNLYSRGFAYVEDPNSPYYRWPILNEQGKWIPRNDREDRVKVGNFNPDFIVGMQTAVSYKRFTLQASFDWRMGGNFQSFTYRYGESDWKSQPQIDNLIPGGFYSEEELIALLKSNPEKYIIPQNGNFPRVGGYNQETGGLPVNVSDGGHDGVFIPGVIMGSDGEYIEHLGGPGTVIYPASNQFPWSFSQQITFDASFIKLRELSLGYDIPNFIGLRNAHFSIFTRNLMVWTAAKIGIDPERAFQVQATKQGDSANLFRQGIELQNVMPWTMPIGFKLNLSL